MWGERIALGLVAALAVGSAGYALRYFDAELPDPKGAAAAVTGGDADRGRAALQTFGCVSCHRVAGLRGTGGMAGPPLRQLQQKLYIAGSLPNTADMLVEWIQHPRQYRPGTAMPETGIGEQQARDVAAYLYSH